MPERMSLNDLFIPSHSPKIDMDDLFIPNRATPKQKQNRESLVAPFKPMMNAIKSQATPIKERLKTFAISGLPAAAGGDRPESAAQAADLVTPALTSVAGAMTGFGPVKGAMVGRGVNEIGKRAFEMKQSESRPVLGFGPKIPGPVNDVIGEGLGAYAGNKAFEVLGGPLKRGGIRIAQRILKPMGKLRDKSEQIAETALKEKVLSSDLGKTSDLIEGKLDVLDSRLEDLIKQYKDRRLSAQDVIDKMDEVEKFYKSNAAPDQAETVSAIKRDFIKAHKLEVPVYQDVESSQFVMRGERPNKQINPMLSKTENVPSALKGKARYESVRGKTGRFERSEPKREIITPKKHLEDPSDIVAMNIPKRTSKTGKSYTPQKIISISPKETFSLQPEVMGYSRIESRLVGKSPRNIPVEEAQSLKRGQYELLKRMRSDAGYSVQSKAPEIYARQAAARGYKEGVAKNVPGADATNERMSRLIDVGASANARLPVASRNNLFDLGDIALTAGGKPGLAMFRKAAGKIGSPTAKAMYAIGTSLEKMSPAQRALTVQLLKAKNLLTVE